MLLCSQLRQLIIKPALYDLACDSLDAEELLMFTCATESKGCSYIKQINGPALGIYQMEPKTYNDIWQNYIRNKSQLSLIMTNNFGCTQIPDEQRLMYDLRFATAMARIHYMRVDEKLPSYKDVDAIWEYYKKYYNTGLGKANKEDAIHNYRFYTLQPLNIND